MNRLRILAGIGLLLSLIAGAPQDRPDPAFLVLDVYVDTGAAQLASWQVEVTLATGKLVGVEGGEPAAFHDAPRYDPAALQGGRVVLAALAVGDTLPTGRVRVARIHVMDEGTEPGTCTVHGAVVAGADGERIESADVKVRRHGDKR